MNLSFTGSLDLFVKMIDVDEKGNNYQKKNRKKKERKRRGKDNKMKPVLK